MTRQSKLASVSTYFSELLKQYKETQRENNAYRIVEIKEKKDGSCELVIQIVGKNVTFKSRPEKLAADDQILENFSRQDVRTITYFATQEIKKPTYKILIHEFCSAFNKMIFSLKKKDKEEVIQKTADQISSDKELLSQLSPEEAHLVGFMSASEKADTDQIEQQAIHDTEIPKHKIVSQEYIEPYDTMVYTLEEKNSKERKQKTATEISKDNKLVKGLTQEDAHKIGFGTASEKDN